MLLSLPEEQQVFLINAILWFGQVAKFRCRNNVAYDNFSRLCFKDIQHLARRDTGLGFETLQVYCEPK